MSDYSMLGSFSTGGASALSGDLLTKLREAEEKAVISPIETKLANIELESETVSEIELKVSALLETVKAFDLFKTDGTIFDQITADTTGDSVLFDAINVGALEEGSLAVSVSQLAQKDVYQSNAFADSSVSATGVDGGGNISISIGVGAAISIDTNNKTYDEIAEAINAEEGLTASVEQVGDAEYRLIIKSTDAGLANSLTITQTDIDLGFNDATDANGDGIPDNHTLVAQNLNATVDGVLYDVSSNSITINGNLKITATQLGDSTLSVQKDTGSIEPAMTALKDAYNELHAIINDDLYSEESTLVDRSSIKSLLDNIKNHFYTEYEDSDLVDDGKLSAFNYGFEFDINGKMQIDTEVLGEALTNNYDNIKLLFLGTAENKGLGTQLKEYIDEATYSTGILGSYSSGMLDRKTDLEASKEKAIEMLDSKYQTMGEQFAAYGAMITQMEAAFGGLKQMIAESVSTN